MLLLMMMINDGVVVDAAVGGALDDVANVGAATGVVVAVCVCVIVDDGCDGAACAL